MKRFTVEATYQAMVELVVEVADEVDEEGALDPANWNEIVSEDQTDYSLQYTESATLNEEE